MVVIFPSSKGRSVELQGGERFLFLSKEGNKARVAEGGFWKVFFFFWGVCH